MILKNFIEKIEDNSDYRRVVFTGLHSQLVMMKIAVGEDIGEEIHATIDQMLFIVDGEGEAVIGNTSYHIKENDAIIIPAGLKHNIRNTGKDTLKLFTVYSPPEHPAETIHKTKKDALDGGEI